MVYRRTENVARRLAERREAIVAAARALAAEGGMAAVQIAPVAARAGIAAGTVYRYFPSKTELVAAVIEAVTERELAAVRAAADAAPGPLSALAAGVTTFAARALHQRRLAWAVIAEPVDPEIDALRLSSRQALVAEFERRLAAAVRAGRVPEQDVRLSAAALVGALVEGLVGPLASTHRIKLQRARRCRRSHCSRCAPSELWMRGHAASWCRPQFQRPRRRRS